MQQIITDFTVWIHFKKCAILNIQVIKQKVQYNMSQSSNIFRPPQTLEQLMEDLRKNIPYADPEKEYPVRTLRELKDKQQERYRR
jgi:hypothetical protein